MGPISFARVRMALRALMRTRNHQSLKCLLQLVQRRESKLMKMPKSQYLNSRTIKTLGQQRMKHSGQCLERSSQVKYDVMADQWQQVLCKRTRKSTSSNKSITVKSLI